MPLPIERANMQQVVMDKAKLVEKVTANRATHEATLNEALANYKDKAIEELMAHIERIREGAVEVVYVMLPMPENHFNDYDRILANLENSIFDEVTLSAQEFDMYVRDNWQWKAGFTETTSLYNNSR